MAVKFILRVNRYSDLKKTLGCKRPGISPGVGIKLTIMNIEEAKQYLCYYTVEADYLLSNEALTESELKIKQNDPDCMCDNCFYGRTKLAKEIIRLLTLKY